MKTRLLLALPIVLLASCANYYATQDQSNPAFRDKLQVDNPALYTQISLRDVKQQRAGELLTVQLTVHHDSMLNERYRYRIEWVDARGIAINNDSNPWLPVTLGANQDYVIQGTAPSPQATNFRLVFAAQ